MESNKVKAAAAGAIGAAAFATFGGPLGGAALAIAEIARAMLVSQEEVKAAEEKGPDELEAVIAKQRRLMEFQVEQARVAQEMAIAQRISSSTDVEIEEFYDESGEIGGELGGSAKGGAVSVKAGAKKAQQRVVRRIYKFKGNAQAG